MNWRRCAVYGGLVLMICQPVLLILGMIFGSWLLVALSVVCLVVAQVILRVALRAAARADAGGGTP